MLRQQKNEVDVLISGMGPAGLTVAYEAAKAGKTVAIVEKRDGNFNRLQRVYIGYSERSYLTTMLLGDKSDKSRLPNEEGYKFLQSLSKKNRKDLFKKLRSIDSKDLVNLKDNKVQANTICEELGIPEKNRTGLIKLLTERPLTIIRDYQDMKLINFAGNPFNESAAVPQIAIKHIERYLMNRIEDMNAKYMKQKKLEPIQILTHSKIKKLNGTNNKTASVVCNHGNHKNEREISFQYLIGADGTKHHLADVVNETLDDKLKFEYTPIPKTKHPSDTHLFAHFILHIPDHELNLARDFSIIKTSSGPDINEPKLCFISLDQHSLKSSTGKSVKCTITAEYPDTSLNDEMKPDETTIQFIKTAMLSCQALHLPNNADIEIEFVDEEKRPSRYSFQSFSTLQLLQANKSTQKIGDDQFFLLIGDAYRHPDYRRSHGTADAISQAQHIGMIVKGEQTMNGYEKLCQTQYNSRKGYYEKIEGQEHFTQQLTVDTDKMMKFIRSSKK